MTRERLPSLVAAPIITIVCVSVLAALLFVQLGHAVRRQATLGFDRTTSHVIRSHTDFLRDNVAVIASMLGGEVVVVAISLALCIAFAARQASGDALFILCTVGGYIALAVFTKNILQQVGPIALFRVPDANYRFPSSHTLGATCLTIALGYFLWRGQQRHRVKALGIVGLFVGVLIGGGSRLVLGFQYPTDCWVDCCSASHGWALW